MKVVSWHNLVIINFFMILAFIILLPIILKILTLDWGPQPEYCHCLFFINKVYFNTGHLPSLKVFTLVRSLCHLHWLIFLRFLCHKWILAFQVCFLSESFWFFAVWFKLVNLQVNVIVWNKKTCYTQFFYVGPPKEDIFIAMILDQQSKQNLKQK